ncbi:MAG: beta-galactosidase [Paracoccaceae bacterium]
MKRTLGVCYYPEHWPEDVWADDARRMAEMGLTWVRIGEFAWSRLERTSGNFDWGWLDRAISTLGEAGLKVVLGTPTATPPRWVVDAHPDMLAVNAEGKTRGFGSRRHYCFSHSGYLDASCQIVREMAVRYGDNPYIAAWQTDNEYGCHDTVLSYSDAARSAFQNWLQERYGQIDTLNRAWGNVFWSMEYHRFDQIALPNLTVTEVNPAHALAFRRFSSDQVVAFNKAQVDIIRAHSQAPITHNYMGRVTEFDHFDVGDDLDIASWDSYPLGFLEDRIAADDTHKAAFARQGDPDFQAFHHDLYRSVGRDRWWVMEQQPGPVNWAPYNPAPLPGMVRLWTWEAFAHGAEAVCYFRWRQAPFAQEQMHAGLLRPDSIDAPAMEEAKQVSKELQSAPDVQHAQAPVALIFDYDADWAWTIQPHGAGLSYFDLVFDHYKALRALGFSVDIFSSRTRDFDGYGLICAPGLMHMDDPLKQALMDAPGQTILGPRSGARNLDFEIPSALPPDLTGSDLKVTHVESLRPDTPVKLAGGGMIQGYLEVIEGGTDDILSSADGVPVAVRVTDTVSYMAGWGDQIALKRVIKICAEKAGLTPLDLPQHLRVRETAGERFWFNYSAEPIVYEGRSIPATDFLFEQLT